MQRTVSDVPDRVDPLTIPVGHIHDVESMAQVMTALHRLHPGYQFAVIPWEGMTHLGADPDQLTVHFVVESNGGRIVLQPGDRVRGGDPAGPYRLDSEGNGQVDETYTEVLWPGDVISVGPADQPAVVHGSGFVFTVMAPVTDYVAPRLTLLRHLADFPGGCAAYPGAFRREALPPQRPPADSPDQRGVNRINEHTLDMRMDREPPPIRHYHGPVAVGAGAWVNHSETAIVLPRAIYGLPEMEGERQGHLVIYRQPEQDPQDTVSIPVRPGSVVVTPATSQHVMGHAFENAFAMLVAIPGFVAPYNYLTDHGTP